MADGTLTRPSITAWARSAPWWAQVVVVFVVSRVITTTILLVYAAIDAAQEGRVDGGPDYFEFATMWDGRWYWWVSTTGYPVELPVGDDGYVGENAWAFMPAFPALVRMLSLGGVLPFPVVAPIVSTLFALGAALVFYRLLVRMLPAGTALFAVVLLCTAPLSAILQVSYAESMHLFLLMVALLLLVERRYLMLIPVVVLMSVTRPSGLAFALLLLMHAVHRFVTRRRDPFPARERVRVVVVGLVSFLAGLAWPAIAWAVTGSMTAYTDTELAWRAPYIGHQHLVPFTSWFQGAEWWLSWWGVPDGASLTLGIIAVLCIVVLFGTFLFTPWARRLAPDLRYWSAAYALYLLAVFFPQSSTFRLLVPLAPLLGALAVPRSRIYRGALVVLGIVGQIVWVHIAWWVDGRDWTPP